jgi:hypothetical protein
MLNLALAKRCLSIMGISWFWCIGGKGAEFMASKGSMNDFNQSSATDLSQPQV